MQKCLLLLILLFVVVVVVVVVSVVVIRTTRLGEEKVLNPKTEKSCLENLLHTVAPFFSPESVTGSVKTLTTINKSPVLSFAKLGLIF